MPNLSIKDVPDAWAEALRQRAARNHRSLQGELMALVEQAVHQGSATPAEGMPLERFTAEAGRVVGFDRHGWPVLRLGTKPMAQVIAELRAVAPEPVLGQPLGVDIVREDRDRR